MPSDPDRTVRSGVTVVVVYHASLYNRHGALLRAATVAATSQFDACTRLYRLYMGDISSSLSPRFRAEAPGRFREQLNSLLCIVS